MSDETYQVDRRGANEHATQRSGRAVGLFTISEGYDRGGKFALYRGLRGLRQYLPIAQDRLALDLFTRRPDGRWLLEAYTDPAADIALESIGCTLCLGEVYDKVTFLSEEVPAA